ncbi:MAG TPA: hypothetical protein VFV47_04740 [Hyphomicrobiaceae bacterium]|nr:hypothetical protein [Hyphomicrobiaceae bacterium]
MHATIIAESSLPGLLLLALATMAFAQTLLPKRACLAGLLGQAAGLG